MNIVHVMAWSYNGGGGFDWYLEPDAADRAFEKEKENCRELAKDGWEAYRFDFKAGDPLFPSITNEIDRDLIDLCAGDKRAKHYKSYRAEGFVPYT